MLLMISPFHLNQKGLQNDYYHPGNKGYYIILKDTQLNNHLSQKDKGSELFKMMRAPLI